jgi:hypothetical protein
MNYSDLLQRVREPNVDADSAFSIARSIAYFFQKSSSSQTESLDLVIRLVDRREEFDKCLPGIGKMIDSIAREAGLYPYVKTHPNWRDELAVEMMRAPGLADVIFHLEQAVVFQKLAEGRSIILSAPTSFGKSLLIDALISHRRPKTVVAVVPTIALLDEFRRRMEARFSDYQVITQSGETRNSSHTIYIGTQERLLDREQFEEIDLFIIDEFYKLDLERSDRRSLALNAVLARYGKLAKQIYLLGPSIDDVPNATAFRPGIEFYKTRYSPVTADIIDRTHIGPVPEELIKDLISVGGSSSLIYVQSPPAASRLATHLIRSKIARRSEFCSSLSDWLRDKFHPEWILADTVGRGIGIHHGRIPRSIAHLMISLFNNGELAAIICTSSMIEGINTAAENVFIYDRNISTTKLDRFTFDNIKGRAGRMFKHNIGKVFLYNPQPQEAQFDVRVPLFSADELMAPELLLQIQDSALTTVARRRKRAISDGSLLPSTVLSDWAEYGVDALNILAERLAEEVKDGRSPILWKGIPSFYEIESTFDVVWNVLQFQKHDVRSPRQLAMYASRLRASKSIREFFDGLVRGAGADAQPDIDRCFNFMRGAEYTFPQVLRAVNDVLDIVAGEEVANYRVFASMLQNLFLPGSLRALDEFGVPLPLIQKTFEFLPEEDLGEARRQLTSPGENIRNRLDTFELELLARGLA